MADSDIIGLTAATALSTGDLFYAVLDPAGTPLDRKITAGDTADALIGLRTKDIVIYKNGSNYTTTSTSLVAIDDTNLPVTVTLAVGDVVELMFEAPYAHSAAGNVIGIDWLVDRPTSADITSLANDLTASVYAAGVINLGNNAIFDNTIPVTTYFTATEAGSHIFKPRWRTGGGTAKISTADATYPAPIVHIAKVI